jgi:hypothetical protein
VTQRPRYQAVDAVSSAARAYKAQTGFWPSRCAINFEFWQCPREVRISDVVEVPQLLSKDSRVQFASHVIACVHSLELAHDTVAMTSGRYSTWRLFNVDKPKETP